MKINEIGTESAKDPTIQAAINCHSGKANGLNINKLQSSTPSINIEDFKSLRNIRHRSQRKHTFEKQSNHHTTITSTQSRRLSPHSRRLWYH